MTALRMKQSSVMLINQIDDNDTALMEKVFLYLSTVIPQKSKQKRELTPEQERRVALVEKYRGAFALCQTEDWKKDKEEYLIEKYGEK